MKIRTTTRKGTNVRGARGRWGPVARPSTKVLGAG